MDHSDPNHMEKMNTEGRKSSRAVFITFGMLILVQVLAVLAVVHLRRRAAMRAAEEEGGSGGWNRLVPSSDEDEDGYGNGDVPEMEGMGGLPSYDESSKQYAPPSYAVVVPENSPPGSAAAPPSVVASPL